MLDLTIPVNLSNEKTKSKHYSRVKRSEKKLLCSSLASAVPKKRTSQPIISQSSSSSTSASVSSSPSSSAVASESESASDSDTECHRNASDGNESDIECDIGIQHNQHAASDRKVMKKIESEHDEDDGDDDDEEMVEEKDNKNDHDNENDDDDDDDDNDVDDRDHDHGNDQPTRYDGTVTTATLSLGKHKRAPVKKSFNETGLETCGADDFEWRAATQTEVPPVKFVTPPPPIGKPPRPVAAAVAATSLDRRQKSATSRQERDLKSRSTHSLKEKSTKSSIESCDDHEGKHHRYSYQRNQYPNNWDHHQQQQQQQQQQHQQGVGPLPPIGPYLWDQPTGYFGGCATSREELRFLDYQRRQRELCSRYGSTTSGLNQSQELFYALQPGQTGYCGHHHNCQLLPAPIVSLQPPLQASCGCYYDQAKSKNVCKTNKRQETDDRLKRLRNDKDSLILQVQVLTEQISAQGEKISDLESGLHDKTQQLNKAEDLLQREMLSRSSLETQKLELMSAMSELKLQLAALERENLDMRIVQTNNNAVPVRRPPMAPVRFTPSNPTTAIAASLHGSFNNLPMSSNNASLPKTPQSYRRQKDNNLHYNSLPRQAFPTAISTITDSPPTMQTPVNDTNANANAKQQRSVAFGKTIVDISNLVGRCSPSADTVTHHGDEQSPKFSLYRHPSAANGVGIIGVPLEKQRGYSVPNLAKTERVIEDFSDDFRSFTPQPSSTSPVANHHKSKGLKGIFDKIRRSNSGNLEDSSYDDFKRGGIRATAGPRLEWSGSTPRIEKAFDKWTMDDLCVWFDDMGFSVNSDLNKWLKNGPTELAQSSPVDIEKELNLKSPLHRKKIVLALAEITGKEKDEVCRNAGKLQTLWIMRWLDDIGLPQYKDAFSQAKCDGRMLNKLTTDDLLTLNVTSCIHTASIRRGIQIMRECNWEADCLIRRSDGADTGVSQIALWTAHRVMEWLRAVDLAEYAPNLRGAGVHGALIVYETRFTAELLANLLSIPNSKTLLRRHLATHFNALLGKDLIQGKRDAENTLGFQPLTLTGKIKGPKKTQFSLKRKKSAKGDSNDEWSDYVCPMGPSGENAQLKSTPNQTTTSTMSQMPSEAEPKAVFQPPE